MSSQIVLPLENSSTFPMLEILKVKMADYSSFAYNPLPKTYHLSSTTHYLILLNTHSSILPTFHSSIASFTIHHPPPLVEIPNSKSQIQKPNKYQPTTHSYTHTLTHSHTHTLTHSHTRTLAHHPPSTIHDPRFILIYHQNNIIQLRLFRFGENLAKRAINRRANGTYHAKYRRDNILGGTENTITRRPPV